MTLCDAKEYVINQAKLFPNKDVNEIEAEIPDDGIDGNRWGRFYAWLLKETYVEEGTGKRFFY